MSGKLIIGLIILIAATYYVRLLWYTARIKRINKLAAEFSLKPSIRHPYILGVYWFFSWNPVDKIEGTVNGHKIEISDDLINWLITGMKAVRGTRIIIDGQIISPGWNFKTVSLGDHNFFISMEKLRELLNDINKGNLPDMTKISSAPTSKQRATIQWIIIGILILTLLILKLVLK